MRLSKDEILIILNGMKERASVDIQGNIEYRIPHERVPKWIDVEDSEVFFGPQL